jgi:hypothetical protein
MPAPEEALAAAAGLVGVLDGPLDLPAGDAGSAAGGVRGDDPTEARGGPDALQTAAPPKASAVLSGTATGGPATGPDDAAPFVAFGGGGAAAMSAEVPVVSIKAVDPNASEQGSSTGAFRLTRAGDPSGELTVSYTVTAGAGQATPGTDYAALSGTATFADGEATTTVVVTPTPDGDTDPGEAVTIALTDGDGYEVDPGAASAAVAIADAGENRAPIPRNDFVEAELGSPIDLDLLANDVDPDGDPLTITEVSAWWGTATVNPDGTVHYVPGQYRNWDDIGYTVSDGRGGTAFGIVRASVPDPEAEGGVGITAADDQASTAAGVPVVIDVLANDSGNPVDPSDPGSPLNASINIQNDPRHGRVEVNAVLIGPYTTYTVTYTPDAGFTGIDTFEYLLMDAAYGVGGDVAKVTVTVGDGESTPPAPAVSITATDLTSSEDGPGTGAVTLTRGGDLTDPLTVTLAYAGTADTTWDYEFRSYGDTLPSTVSFASGQDTLTLVLKPYNDDEVEDTESAEITVVAPGNGSYIPAAQPSVTVDIANATAFAEAGEGNPKPFGDPPPAVNDNPPNMNGQNLTVVFVLGSAQERSDWATKARPYFGATAFIYNNVYNVADLAAALQPFAAGSISRLVIGGHGTYEDRVGVQPTNNSTQRPAGAAFIDNVTLDQDPMARATIIARLANDAEVEFHSCGPKTDARLEGDNSGAQRIANLLQHRVWFVIGDARSWGDVDKWDHRDPKP